MKIKVLGPGCKNCAALEKVTVEAVHSLGMDATVEKVTDYRAIVATGVIATPALVLDDRVVCAGRVPTAREVAELITTHGG